MPLDKKYYYSETNDSNISDSDLEHVKKVGDAFNITNLGEYHDLYVSLDVALLADVFENFRDLNSIMVIMFKEDKCSIRTIN